MSAALAIDHVRGTGGFGYGPGEVYHARSQSLGTRTLLTEAFPQVWNSKVYARLSRLQSLKRGWDGYSAKPVDRSVLHFASTLLTQIMRPDLPVPAILPLAYGGLQLEWHRKGWDLEIEIAQPFVIQAWAHELETGREIERSLSADLAELDELLDKVADSHT